MNTRKNIALLALLFMSLTCLTVSYMAGHQAQIYLFNADQLYLPTLFTDLLARQGQMADWFLTPAPYFFPDFALFAPAYLIGSGAYSQVVIFSILQSLATLAGLWLIARQVHRPQALALATTGTIALIALALGAGDPFEFMLASATHYGIFVTALLFVGLWLQHEAKPEKQSNGLWALMIIIAFLSTLSDNLFLVQVAAPFVAITLLLDLLKRTISVARFIRVLTPALASVAGALSYPLAVSRPTRYPAHLGLDNLTVNLKASADIFLEVVSNTPIYGIILLAYLGLILHLILRLARATNRPQQADTLAWLTLFSLTASGATLAATALSTDLLVVPRYFIATYSWPVIIVLFSLAGLLGQRLFGTCAALSAAAVMSSAIGTYKLADSNGISTRHYPDELACIDAALSKAKARHGISQYWDSKYLQSFSQLELSIAAHHEDLTEMPWITSSRYFKTTYDFAIISERISPPAKIRAEPIMRINPTGTEQVTCGSRAVIISPSHQLNMQKFAAPGGTYQWPACELPSLIGQSNANCSMEKKSIEQAGFLTFGPYESLPPGEYRLTISYTSTESEQNDAGEWDALLGSTVLAKGVLHGSRGELGEVRAQISVLAGQEPGKLEVRNQAYAQKDLSIQSLRVERLR